MKGEPREHFEIFVDSVYGSDILYADTFEEAVHKANAWAKDIESDLNVVVLRVTEQVQMEIKGRREKK